MRITVLGSGSRGNAILVDGTEGSVLVDAGFGKRELQRRFLLANREPGEVGAVLLTHEHTDHACGARAASVLWGWPVVAVEQTHAALAALPGGAPAHTALLSFKGATTVCGFDVECVLVPHDARACAALRLTDRASGARVGIAMDLGHVPERLPAFFALCDMLVVESNHDSEMLANGPYPQSLKRRVAGRLGHLSNMTAASLIARVAHKGLRAVVLAHLSETNNTPVTALACARAALRKAGRTFDAVHASSQGSACGPLHIAGGPAHHPRVAQLCLVL